MDWVPVWARTTVWHRSPPRSPRRHQQKKHTGAAHRQQHTEHGTNSSINLPERASSPPPPPLPPPTPGRRLASVVLGLSAFLAAAALLRPESTRWRQQQQPSPSSSKAGAEAEAGGISELPFLEGMDGGGKGEADAAHWVRVRSSTAMHPAMYVPGDGMVYCPIAKVREGRTMNVSHRERVFSTEGVLYCTVVRGQQ